MLDGQCAPVKKFYAGKTYEFVPVILNKQSGHNATKSAKEFHSNLCKSSKQLPNLYKQLGDHVGDKDKEECPTERHLSGLDA